MKTKKKKARAKKPKLCPKCNAECNGSKNLCDLFAQGNRFQGYHRPGNWPIASDAMSVSKKQLALAKKLDHERGAPPTEYRVDKYTAKPIFTSQRHRAKFLRAHGMKDNHGVMG